MTKIKIRRKREDLGTHNQNHRQTVIKTDRQIHREKDNTLARKPIGSHYVGGIHCETHTHTHLILFKNNLTEYVREQIILMNTTVQVAFLNNDITLVISL